MSRGVFQAPYAFASGTLAELRLAQGRVEDAARVLRGAEGREEAAAAVASVRLQQGEPSAAAAVLRRRLATTSPDRLDVAAVIELLGEAEIALRDTGAAIDRGRALITLGAVNNCDLIVAHGERLLGHALLVIAGEDRARRWSSQVCRSMVPPSVVTVASRYRASPSRKMPYGAGVSSQSAVCAWVEGMRGASRSSRRRGQILSGWVPDIGSCWLSRAGIAVGSTITVGQRAVCFPDGQFFLPLRAHTPAGGRSARPMRCWPACY